MKRLNFKLVKWYYGLYQIEERIANVAYKLKLLDSSKIHLVFRISLLKENVREKPNEFSRLPEKIYLDFNQT